MQEFIDTVIARVRASDPTLGLISIVADSGESRSNKMERLLAKYNMEPLYTNYNTPEVNSVIERVWRTIQEMATSMLLDSELPETY